MRAGRETSLGRFEQAEKVVMECLWKVAMVDAEKVRASGGMGSQRIVWMS